MSPELVFAAACIFPMYCQKILTLNKISERRLHANKNDLYSQINKIQEFEKKK